MSNPSHNHTLLDLFKRGLISQEELEAGLTDTASSPPTGDTSKPAAAPGEYRSQSGYVTVLGQIRIPQEGGILAGMFRLNRPIGRGAMGVVWLADDLPGKRAVCVKLLPPEVQHDLTELGRVREMFQKVHTLQHQHLCPVYLLGSDPLCGEFLVMKYIDGQTLSEYRRTYVEQHGEFPLTEVVRILTPVAEALDYVHSQGLIHRDVKPANIMVSRDGQTVQLVDLGLAAEIQGSMSRVSKAARDIAGTAPYMAPEQWNGDFVDGRTDQYSFATVVYQMAAGMLPFDAASEVVWMNCTLNKTPRPIANLAEQSSGAILRGMEKNRDHRFPKCVELIQHLDSPGKPKVETTSLPPRTKDVAPSAKVAEVPPLKRKLAPTPILPPPKPTQSSVISPSSPSDRNQVKVTQAATSIPPASPQPNAKAPRTQSSHDLRNRLLKTPYDRQLRTEYLRSRTPSEKHLDVRNARCAGPSPMNLGCIVIGFITAIVVNGILAKEGDQWEVAVAGIAVIAIVQFIYRIIVRGRRSFLADRYGPIPDNDLDLSKEDFDKRPNVIRTANP